MYIGLSCSAADGEDRQAARLSSSGRLECTFAMCEADGADSWWRVIGALAGAEFEFILKEMPVR